MITVNSTSDEMREYAQNTFGRKIPERYHEDTVKEKFAEMYREETGGDLPGDPTEDGTSPEPEGQKLVAVTINIAPGKHGKEITGAVNGQAYQLRCAENIRVPVHIYESLKNAERLLMDEETGELAIREMAYPFSVIERHYE